MVEAREDLDDPFPLSNEFGSWKLQKLLADKTPRELLGN